MKNNIKDIQKKRNPKSIALKELIESDNDDFLDLIAKCLTFDPKKRIKPHLALLHPWIINELPIEIKHLYLKECQELTHEIEKYEKNSLEKVILIDEGFKLKQVKSLKSNSLEKKIKNKENSRNKEKLLKKSNQYYGLSTEKNEIKGNMKNIELFSNFINLKDTRKNKNFSKKKSITFHGVQEY